MRHQPTCTIDSKRTLAFRNSWCLPGLDTFQLSAHGQLWRLLFPVSWAHGQLDRRGWPWTGARWPPEQLQGPWRALLRWALMLPAGCRWPTTWAGQKQGEWLHQLPRHLWRTSWRETTLSRPRCQPTPSKQQTWRDCGDSWKSATRERGKIVRVGTRPVETLQSEHWTWWPWRAGAKCCATWMTSQPSSRRARRGALRRKQWRTEQRRGEKREWRRIAATLWCFFVMIHVKVEVPAWSISRSRSISV